MKFWFELEINAEQSTLADYEAQLIHQDDVLAVTISAKEDQEEVFDLSDGDFSLWTQSKLTVLFDNETSMLHTISLLKLEPIQYAVKVFQNEDWLSKCRDLFKPKSFGDKIWLYPSWEKPNQNKAVNICLDPGMAFGTGEHETTTLCLQWLDRYIKPNQTVIDYGCGTGVLAIAAAKLGARKVTAVDIDPLAVAAAKKNIADNGLSDRISVYHTEEFSHQETYDVIVANILARPLISLKQNFSNLIANENATLLVSGVLEAQLDWLLENYKPEFSLYEKNTLNNWLSACFKRVFK